MGDRFLQSVFLLFTWLPDSPGFTVVMWCQKMVINMTLKVGPFTVHDFGSSVSDPNEFTYVPGTYIVLHLLSHVYDLFWCHTRTINAEVRCRRESHSEKVCHPCLVLFRWKFTSILINDDDSIQCHNTVVLLSKMGVHELQKKRRNLTTCYYHRLLSLRVKQVMMSTQQTVCLEPPYDCWRSLQIN